VGRDRRIKKEVVMIPTLLAAVTLLSLSLILHTQPVRAHAAFVTSDPAPDAVLDAVPEQLRIIFSEVISSKSTVNVTAPDGNIVSGEVVVDGRVATTTLQPGAPGIYTVQWSNISLDDGHESSGMFQFTVGGG
jgi:methionine-rich copper-binding protein CopC